MATGIALLGSTGSIGRQTLAVIDFFPEKFKIISLAAGKNIELLEEQIIKYKPKIAIVADREKGNHLKNKLGNYPVQIFSGQDQLHQGVVAEEVETVITGLSGVAGLLPTLKAIEAGKNIALANKETLVAAGELVMNAVEKYAVNLLPVDSEHSAIFQCLQGNRMEDVRNIILTASGGPFRSLTADQLKNVSVEQSLKHPNWEMGRKITVDSATMMNKGLEVIEAKHLFKVDFDRIKVVIHPESIIHSMVEYIDGSIMAQMAPPNMQLPIQYALSYPERWQCSYEERLNPKILVGLTFEEPNTELFPALDLAYRAGKTGGTMPAVLNAANEVAVASFLDRRIGFTDIWRVVETAMSQHSVIYNPSLEAILEADATARDNVSALIGKMR
ncbi:MAG: 1-deoxy-D-xylulose-5-phosphate reductoisomerase [Bacillota bacterium]